MASALRQAIRIKLSPADADAIAQRYARFGDREHALAAYYRRRYRQNELGIHNIAHATPEQVFQARQAGALGYGQNDLGLGGPVTVNAPADQGARTMDPAQRMAGVPLPGAQAMPAAPAATAAAPPLSPVVPAQLAQGPQLSATPLGTAMFTAVRDQYGGRARRRRPLRGGGGGGGGG